MKLEQLLTTVEEEQHLPFPARHLQWSRPQVNLDTRLPHVLLGYFYERTHAALFGGTHLDNKLASVPIDTRGWEVMPDVVDEREKVVTEVKGCRNKYKCTMTRSQLDGHGEQQEEFQDWTFRFAFYRHRLPAIRSFMGTADQLFGRLAKCTTHALVLPLSVIYRFHEDTQSGDRRAGRDYRQVRDTGYVDCMELRSTMLDQIFLDPTGALAEYGFNPQAYIWVRFKTPRLRVVADRTYYMPGFPLLVVEDKAKNR